MLVRRGVGSIGDVGGGGGGGLQGPSFKEEGQG